MTKAMLTALMLGISFSGFTFAQTPTDSATPEGETSMKIEQATDKKNKVDGDIDLEITNAKLRAESGSKSRYSMSLTGTYNGGSLEKPIDAQRPDLYASTGEERVTSVMGDVAARYRLSKNDSLTLGLGVGMITPFQGDVDGASNQFKVNDPNVGWNRAFQKWGLQNILDLSVYGGTSKVSRAIDRTAYPVISYTLLKSFPNGLSLGVNVSADYIFYSSQPGDNPANAISGYGGDDRTEYDLGVFPFMEYQFTDRLAFRTVTRYTSWFHRYGTPDALSLLHETGTQSAGIGISVTRDIYLYPNVQFLWEDMSSERTNVALNTTINIF